MKPRARHGWLPALPDRCFHPRVETLGLTGTGRSMVFFVIHLKSRAVEVAGLRSAPDGKWMKQIAGNLLDPTRGFLRGAKFLVHDRDPVFPSD